MVESKANGAKRIGAARGLVFGVTAAVLLLPLLLVSFLKPLQALSIPLQVEVVRTVEYVSAGDRPAVEGYLQGIQPLVECWREVPSGRLARLHEGAVEQFTLGAVAPISRVPDAAAVEAELAETPMSDCWYATGQLRLVQRSLFSNELVELTGLGPAVVWRGEIGPPLRFGVLLFVVAGALAAVLGRRRVTGEVAGAAVLAAVVQLLLWLRAVGFSGARFGGELRIVGDGFEMNTAFGVFACGLAAVYVLGGLGGALAGSVGVDAVTKEQPCVRCGHRYPSSPLPAACPACAAPVDRRGVQWPVVVVALGITLILVDVLLLDLGEALSVFLQCLPRKMSQACRVAWHGADNGWMGYGSLKGGASGKGFAVVLHQVHYLAYTAVLMFVGPFLLAWRLPRGARPSALALVGANWVGASILVGTLLGSVGASGVFVIVFQTQMLAALAWGVAGVAGAMLGHVLRQRSGATMFEEVDG